MMNYATESHSVPPTFRKINHFQTITWKPKPNQWRSQGGGGTLRECMNQSSHRFGSVGRDPRLCYAHPRTVRARYARPPHAHMPNCIQTNFDDSRRTKPPGLIESCTQGVVASPQIPLELRLKPTPLEERGLGAEPQPPADPSRQCNCKNVSKPNMNKQFQNSIL